MNVDSIVSHAEAASGATKGEESALAGLHDAVHDMAQPLTALSFLLELARLQTDPEALRTALTDASVECTRAFQVMEEIRAAIHSLDGNGGWRQ